jgi:hypothetical protein
LAATIKARWICEQAHQQLKEELGLDHFEGRSWQGLHRHALMTMIAYAFLQHRRLAQAGRKKKNQRTSASTKLAGRTPRHRRSHSSTAISAMPILQQSAKVVLEYTFFNPPLPERGRANNGGLNIAATRNPRRTFNGDDGATGIISRAAIQRPVSPSSLFAREETGQ